MVEALLDTVILIDHLNGVPAATEWLREQDWGTLAISVITRAEVLTGCSHEELPHISHLLDMFTCLPIDTAAADLAAAIRKKKKLKLPDAFQAALAEKHNILLVTRNTKNFPENRFEYVRYPYSIS